MCLKDKSNTLLNNLLSDYSNNNSFLEHEKEYE